MIEFVIVYFAFVARGERPQKMFLTEIVQAFVNISGLEYLRRNAE